MSSNAAASLTDTRAPPPLCSPFAPMAIGGDDPFGGSTAGSGAGGGTDRSLTDRGDGEAASAGGNRSPYSPFSHARDCPIVHPNCPTPRGSQDLVIRVEWG